MHRSEERDRDRSEVPVVELSPKVVGKEASRSNLVGRETTFVEGSLARRPSPTVEVTAVEIDDGGDIACNDSPAFGLGDGRDMACDDSPAFGLGAFLLSFPKRFLKFHYMRLISLYLLVIFCVYITSYHFHNSWNLWPREGLFAAIRVVFMCETQDSIRVGALSSRKRG